MESKSLFGICIEKKLKSIKSIEYSDLKLRAIGESIKNDPSDVIEYFKKFLTIEIPCSHKLCDDITFDSTFVTWSYNVDDNIVTDSHTFQVIDIEIYYVIRLYLNSINDDYELSKDQLKILVDITEKYWYEKGKDEIKNKIKEFNELFNPAKIKKYMPY